MIFTSLTDQVTVKRLSYTGQKGVKTTIAGVSYFGLMTPIDSNENTVGLKLVGQGFKFSTDAAADIQAGDVLVWQGEDYSVKGIQRYRQKSLNNLYCYLDKPQNNG